VREFIGKPVAGVFMIVVGVFGEAAELADTVNAE